MNSFLDFSNPSVSIERLVYPKVIKLMINLRYFCLVKRMIVIFFLTCWNA